MDLSAADLEKIKEIMRQEVTGTVFRRLVGREVRQVVGRIGKGSVPVDASEPVVSHGSSDKVGPSIVQDTERLSFIRLELATQADMLEDHEERISKLERMMFARQPLNEK
ncbi:MAG: hypothetical protein PHG63_03570 [Candidatus Dojkabacteria bacterium]|jgi:hypothetical protein|nr:hypothetical protein [Candidatus Dojkabacteria bacterium]